MRTQPHFVVNQAKRNALTYEMWQGLPVVLDDFASDSAVRVIVPRRGSRGSGNRTPLSEPSPPGRKG